MRAGTRRSDRLFFGLTNVGECKVRTYSTLGEWRISCCGRNRLREWSTTSTTETETVAATQERPTELRESQLDRVLVR